MPEDDVARIQDEAREGMEKAIRSFKAELQKIRTGRANVALLDGIQVEYYGTPTPLNQVANLTTPDPRLIVVSPYDKGAIGDIEKAIMKADLGLSPSSDGKVVRVPVPPLTEERRKDLVKQVHRAAEDHKVGIRESRRDALSMLKDLESEGALPKDDKHREEKKIQALTDAMVKQVDAIAAQKEEDILQV
ncbi:MAG: ribosome recycling factor [Myxococcales bacterium]|nr:ribosome recycling factor [Myxococcales bacterium]